MTKKQLICLADKHGVPLTMQDDRRRLRSALMQHFALGQCFDYRGCASLTDSAHTSFT